MFARPLASTTQRAVTLVSSSSWLSLMRVRVGADLDVLHAPAAERLGAVLQAAPEQLVLEASAIDLVRVGREVRGRAELDPLRDVAVVAGGQEEPEAVLAELRLLEVIAHADTPRGSSARPPRRSTRRP